ncbi:MAG: hypothetical protein WCO54_07730 [Bacteroidota bacterium]
MTYQVNILNPKATKLLQDLADLNLISLEQFGDDNFLKTVSRLRKKSSSASITLKEITKEVEAVRNKRYASKKA